MSKLHELLAVEIPLSNQSAAVRQEAIAAFEKKRHLYEEKRITFTENREGAIPVVESQSEISTTIPDELEWLFNEHMTKAIDASYAIDVANTSAKANVVLEDGTTIAEDVPATALLALEKNVLEVVTVLKAIPTFDPAKAFKLDPDHAKGAFKAREVVKDRTKQTKKVLVKYEATDKHPAQTEVYEEAVPIGKILEQEWSGLITPLTKSKLIERAEDLARAIKKARARANNVEVDTSTTKIGKKLFNHILEPLKA